MTESTGSPLIIGAGPAGLTAAIRLVEKGVTPVVLEASGQVGGLARTLSQDGWRVDMGGHRFFTHSEEILDLWKSLLPYDQWISVRRRSAMLVDGHHVRYPLVGRDLLTQMGPWRGMRGLSSFLWSRFRAGPRVSGDSESFRAWGVHTFGSYWYEKFFDGYVRKTWLTDPDDITSDWANQRIKPIDWRVGKRENPVQQDVFRYPRQGPGRVWEAAAARLADAGVAPRLNAQVVKVDFDQGRWAVELHDGEILTGSALFSSMPLRLLVDALNPRPPQKIVEMAAALKHRSLIVVAVALRTRLNLPFNWIYTPGSNVRVGRIQNYGRWSDQLTPEGWDGAFLGLEYFVKPDDQLCSATDADMKAIAERDLRALGIDATTIERIMVGRSEFAYPIYDRARERCVTQVNRYLNGHFPSLFPMGRNGMHHYDNQDHAMLSALQSVALYFGERVDPWQVNTDRFYQETGPLKR